MVTRRTLPPEEWDRVRAIEPFRSGGLPDPQSWRIVVVERDGVIVASCSLYDAVHWDCFYVAEQERGNPVVFKELIEGGADVMDAYGISLVHTTVPHHKEGAAAMLLRFGFTKAEGDLFYYQRSPAQKESVG